MSQAFDFKNSSKVRAACEQGSVFATGLYLRDGCSETPTDLTGCTVKMQVRETPASSTVILEISTANGYAVIDPLNGKISITVPSSVTATLPPGLYVYDLDLISVANSKRIIEGQFEITAEVTQ